MVSRLRGTTFLFYATDAAPAFCQDTSIFGQQGEKQTAYGASHEKEHHLISSKPGPCTSHGQVGLAGVAVHSEVAIESSQSGGGRFTQRASLTSLD